MTYSWERTCQSTRLPTSTKRTKEEIDEDTENKLCKECDHYSFYFCNKKNEDTAPNADNEGGRHNTCFQKT